MAGLVSVVAAGRRLVSSTLIDRAVRLRLVTTRDSVGGSWSAWEDTGGKIRVRFTALSEAGSAGRSSRAVAGQIEEAPGGIVLVPLDSALTEGDRLRDVASGRVFVILSEITAPSKAAVIRRLYIREV